MKEKIELLVRKVVMELLNKEKEEMTDKQVLIILDDHPDTYFNRADVWEQLKGISHHYQTTIFHTDKWGELPEDVKHIKMIPLRDENLDQIKAEIQNADVLFYATAGYSTLSKLSLTIDDNLPMWITIQMQLNGKKLLLANDFFSQKGTQKVTVPFTVSKRLNGYLRTLREDKVQVLAMANARKWLDSYFDSFAGRRHVVLAKHIEEAAKLGESELIVPKNSLITPMCKDYARELGIRIRQKE